MVTEGNACGAISSTVYLTLDEPINMEYLGFSMLSVVSPNQTAMQEIPTALAGLGMTSM